MSPINLDDLAPKSHKAKKLREAIRFAINDLISSVLKEGSSPSKDSLEILANAFSDIDLSIIDILENTDSIKTASNIVEEQNNKIVRSVAHHLGYTMEVGERKNPQIKKTTQYLIAKECHELRKTLSCTEANEITAKNNNICTRTVQKYYKAEKGIILFIEAMLKDPNEIFDDGYKSAMEAAFGEGYKSAMETALNYVDEKQK